eukprot:m.43136 g.43136  ORF g.43136 m.43136 type:complete len:192 (-) comp19305_c0_seq1:287-862(-)
MVLGASTVIVALASFIAGLLVLGLIVGFLIYRKSFSSDDMNDVIRTRSCTPTISLPNNDYNTHAHANILLDTMSPSRRTSKRFQTQDQTVTQLQKDVVVVAERLNSNCNKRGEMSLAATTLKNREELELLPYAIDAAAYLGVTNPDRKGGSTCTNPTIINHNLDLNNDIISYTQNTRSSDKIPLLETRSWC